MDICLLARNQQSPLGKDKAYTFWKRLSLVDVQLECRLGKCKSCHNCALLFFVSERCLAFVIMKSPA